MSDAATRDRRTRVESILAGAGRSGPALAASGRDAEPTAADELLPLLYDELRELARRRMSRRGPGMTLQPTALVHEAWMRLADGAPHGWDGRRHFFGAAARAMRNVLVDHARARGAAKRGGDRRRVDLDGLDGAALAVDAEPGGLLELDAALERLAAEHPRPAEVVALRFFAGLDHARIGELLGVSRPTVERDWRLARAWLARSLDGDGDDRGAGEPAAPAGDAGRAPEPPEPPS